MWSKESSILCFLFLVLAILVGGSSQEPQLGSARVVFQVLSFPVFFSFNYVWISERPILQPKSTFTIKALFDDLAQMGIANL